MGYDTKDGLYYGYKYKARIAVDAEEELPVAVITTSARSIPRLSCCPSWKNQIQRHRVFLCHGDAGYDARENYVGVGEVFGAVPVIPRTEELQSYRQRTEEPSQLGA